MNASAGLSQIDLHAHRPACSRSRSMSDPLASWLPSRRRVLAPWRLLSVAFVLVLLAGCSGQAPAAPAATSAPAADAKPAAASKPAAGNLPAPPATPVPNQPRPATDQLADKQE